VAEERVGPGRRRRKYGQTEASLSFGDEFERWHLDAEGDDQPVGRAEVQLLGGGEDPLGRDASDLGVVCYFEGAPVDDLGSCRSQVGDDLLGQREHVRGDGGDLGGADIAEGSRRAPALEVTSGARPR